MKGPRNTMRFTLFAVLLLGLISSSIAVRADESELDGKSSLVVDGTVTLVESQNNANSVQSHATVTVRRVHKGSVKEKDVRIKYLGGTLESGKGMFQSDQPIFSVGETVRLYLRQKDDAYEVVDGPQGKMKLDQSSLQFVDENTAAGYKLFWFKPGSGSQQSTTRPGPDWYGPLRWDSGIMPVGYWIDTRNMPTGISESSFTTYAQNCYQTWEDEPSSTIDYTYRGVRTDLEWGVNDGVNLFSWRYIDGNGGTLGIARIYYYMTDQLNYDSLRLEDSDIELDIGDQWSAAEVCPSGKFDVQNVGTHEAGHTTGLADLYDSSDSQMTMYGYSSPSQTSQRDLDWGDIAGVQALYGSSSPQPYPSDRWGRDWHVYSGNPSSPWTQLLGSSPDETNLCFDTNWGTGTVSYSRTDNIGFRSYRTVNLEAGSWTFTIGGDDGIRLYIDDALLVNGWKAQGYTVYSQTISFGISDNHRLRLEYFEATGNARASFSATHIVPDFQVTANPTSLNLNIPLSGTTQQLSIITVASINGFSSEVTLSGAWIGATPNRVSTVFNPVSLIPSQGGSTSSTLTLTVASDSSTGTYTFRVNAICGSLTHSVDISILLKQIPSDRWRRDWYVYSGNPSSPWGQPLGQTPDEVNLNFDNNWGKGSVAYGRSDKICFSSSRTVNLDVGEWTFTVGGDDGVRLYLDDQLLISQWKDQGYSTYSYKTSLSSKADHTLRLEYFENGGDARVSFAATPPPAPPAPDFGLSAQPASITIVVPDSGSVDGSSTITISSLNGFSSAVSLSCVWISSTPSGVSLNLNPDSVTPPVGASGTSALAFCVETGASTGTFSLRVSGATGSLSHSADVSVVLMPPVPSDCWDRDWYVYSGSLSSPWSQSLGSTPDEMNLNFDNNWGSGTVAFGRSDKIGFVSSRKMNLGAGTWKFTIAGDDGVRLYIDDQLAINGWKLQGYTTYSYTTTFSSTNDHALRLEWFESTGDARVSFTLIGPPSPDFALSTNPSTVIITVPSSGSVDGLSTTSVSSLNGFSSQVSLSYTWIGSVPDAVTCNLNPDTVTLTPGSSSVSALTITVGSAAPAATFTLRITGTSATLNHITDIQVVLSTSASGLKGEYYSSSSRGQFTTKIGERIDSTINFDWGSSSPFSGVPVDRFAVRWTGSILVSTSGMYTIYVTADDGVRVWIDGQLVIDRWKDQAPTEYSWNGSLSAGKHAIKVEYYENSGGALVKLGWTIPGTSKTYPIPSSNLTPS